MFDIKIMKEHCFHDGVITKCTYSVGCNYFYIEGDFPEEETENSGLKYFSFSFSHISESTENEIPCEVSDPGIIDLEIDRQNDKYSVKICLENDLQFICLKFICEGINCSLMKYKGMSYKNIYGSDKWKTARERQLYVCNEKYLTDSDTYDLPDGYTLEIKEYTDIEKKGPNYSIQRAFIQKCVLKKFGETFYEFISDYNHVNPFFEFADHINGYRYFPFHIDLYGISYLELETKKVYNYIPEGCQHDFNYSCGESFIITDIHYDRNTNLIAYGGCYWAAPSDVMVGDFSNPLSFNPKLISIHEIIDPEYEEFDDFDFVRWEKDKLIVNADHNKEFSIEIDEIFKRLED